MAGDLEVLATAPAEGDKKSTRVYLLLPRDRARRILAEVTRTTTLTITRGFGPLPKPEPAAKSGPVESPPPLRPARSKK